MNNVGTAKRRITFYCDYGGLLGWAMLLVAVLALVLINPDEHSVAGVYRWGSQHFLSGQPLYDLKSMMGYLYSPTFAVIYAPFYWLGPRLGDALWRIAGFGVLTYAAARQTRLIDDARPLRLISVGLLLATPLSAGAVRNGQATILLAGASWLLILAVLERKRLQTILWATIAIVAKPTAIVAMLLSCALRPRFIPLMVLAAVILLVLPYGFAPAHYVTDLYRSFFALIDAMSVGQNADFQPADFTAPFTVLNIPIPPTIAFAVRAVAAVAALAAALWFARNGPKGTAGLVIFAIAAYYMSVFNPRVERNTYALLAVPFGLSISLMYRREGISALSATLGAILFLSGFAGVDLHILMLVSPWSPVISTVLFAGIIWWFWSRIREPNVIGAHG